MTDLPMTELFTAYAGDFAAIAADIRKMIKCPKHAGKDWFMCQHYLEKLACCAEKSSIVECKEVLKDVPPDALELITKALKQGIAGCVKSCGQTEYSARLQVVASVCNAPHRISL